MKTAATHDRDLYVGRVYGRAVNLSNGGPKGVVPTTVLKSLSLSIHQGNVVRSTGDPTQDARPHGRAPMGESTRSHTPSTGPATWTP